MNSHAACCKRQPTALAMATSFLSGCANASSDTGITTVCPPVVAYSSEFQAMEAEELALLRHGSTIIEMRGDFAVLQAQVRGTRVVRSQGSAQEAHLVNDDEAANTREMICARRAD